MGEIVQGNIVTGGSVVTGSVVGDPDVVLFSSDFSIGTGGMTLYNGDGVGTVAITGGELGLTVNAGGTADSFWFDADQGVLVYVPISGDFDARALIRVRNSADSGLPTVGDGNFRIAGLAAHDPDRTTLDYVHVGMGCTASAAITVETKNTVADVSDYDEFTTAGASTGIGEVRIVREGQIFRLYYRAATTSPWTLESTYDRTAAPMPSLTHVGFIAYSNQAVHDIRLFAQNLVITRP